MLALPQARILGQEGIEMFGLQPIHVIFIAFIALLIFGPSRFGAIGRSLGTTIREFRAASKEPATNEEEKS
jgi:TatA/E family protein of Tat protein translocase